MSVKINQLEIENVKRVKAVSLMPSAEGLTIIGGDNGQGKTSVLDSIAWALGGDRKKPSEPHREGSVLPPYISVKLSNGIIVERRGKNSDLKITDPSGRKGGQQLLNEFVEELAIDLPRFMQASARDKAETLLKIIGVGPQLHELERLEKERYNERLAVGRIAEQKKAFAASMPYFPEAPETPVSISELIRLQQDILARNGENQRKRAKRDELEARAAQLSERMKALGAELGQVEADLKIARTAAQDLIDESTAELEDSIGQVEQINIKVRANLDKLKADEDARDCEAQYDSLTEEISELRHQKKALLEGAALPLPGLSVEDGELIFNGAKWDCMSGADQLRVATAIVKALNPDCGFVLLDKLEQMDLGTLREFGAWLEYEGLQAIATRVSTGDECSIIIEDGTAIADSVKTAAAPVWTEGVF